MPLISITPYKQIVLAIYATLNPADKHANVTLGENNLLFSSSTGAGVRATQGKSTGKWYWEAFLVYSGMDYGAVLGIVTAAAPLQSTWGTVTTKYIWYVRQTQTAGSKGQLITANNVRIDYGAASNTGDTIGIKLDLDANTMEFTKNGVAQGVFNIAPGTYFPFVSDPTVLSTVRMNFGQSAFKYPVPAGYNTGVFI